MGRALSQEADIVSSPSPCPSCICIHAARYLSLVLPASGGAAPPQIPPTHCFPQLKLTRWNRNYLLPPVSPAPTLHTYLTTNRGAVPPGFHPCLDAQSGCSDGTALGLQVTVCDSRQSCPMLHTCWRDIAPETPHAKMGMHPTAGPPSSDWLPWHMPPSSGNRVQMPWRPA